MAFTVPRFPAASTTGRYFEGYGFRIPIFKLGKAIPHARLSSELAKGSREKLSAIVGDFLQNAGKASRLIKALHSKPAIADWIESAETLVLPPHPESKLPSTKKEDLIKVLGLEAPIRKAKPAKVEKYVPRKRPDPQQDAPKAGENPKARPTASSVSKAGVRGAERVIKRKFESAAQPAESKQTPVKKTKLLHVASRPAISPPADSPPSIPSSPILAPRISPPPTPSPRTASPAPSPPTPPPRITSPAISSPPRIPEVSQLPPPSPPQASQEQEELPLAQSPPWTPDPAPQDSVPDKASPHPLNDSTCCIVNHPTYTTITTLAPLSTYNPEFDWWGYSTGTLPNGQTLPTREIPSTTIETPTLYSTYVPLTYDADACPKRPSSPTPFLKPGRHGRHGDFTDDPDLHTGRGHQVEPQDLEGKQEYEAAYRQFHKMWPSWPYADAPRTTLVGRCEEKEDLDALERWMSMYRERYQGENFAHLWACGCVVPLGDDESEYDSEDMGMYDDPMGALAIESEGALATAINKAIEKKMQDRGDGESKDESEGGGEDELDVDCVLVSMEEVKAYYARIRSWQQSVEQDI